MRLFSWLLLLGILGSTADPAAAQAPGAVSHGIQDLRISYDECRQRADAALRAEGFAVDHTSGAFTFGTKGVNRASLVCYGNALGGTGVAIVVMSNTNDANVPGAERVRLQQRMDQAVVRGDGACDIQGRWRMTGSFGESVWTFTPRGDGTYGATEAGLGNATGTATVTGNRMTLPVTFSGGSGVFEYQLAPDCRSATGQIFGRPVRLDRLP